MPHSIDWAMLARLPTIGSVTAHRLLSYFNNNVSAIFKATSADWKAAGCTAKQIHELNRPDWRAAEQDCAWLARQKGILLPCSDAAYPALLSEIYDAPSVLYVLGDSQLLQRPQLAMVGSRNPTVTGRDLATQFAKELTHAGLVVTSGLALGIDAASHQGALQAMGQTIAVLGTGLQHIYPRSHQKLAAAIQESGALITEFPPDTPPKTMHFPMRNRIISGLSAGVLVVEAALRSGSLITARCAVEQNREVFAIPGSIHNPLARGCHQLIRQGAKLIETTAEILEELQWLTAPATAPQDPATCKLPIDLDPPFQRVLAQIGYEVTALDVIIRRVGLTASEVSSMLLSLELKGYIRKIPGGYIR